jgi:hypothetical protein
VTSTPWLSAKEFSDLHCTEDALERLSNSGRFRRTLEYLFMHGEQSPFDLFHQFGLYCAQKGTDRIPLDVYSTLVYDYFSTQKGIDKTVLRDAMVCDRLSTNASGKLPDVLRVKDPALKTAVLFLEQNEETRSKKGVKRGVALLYSENCAVYADYKEKNPITGEYPLFKIKDWNRSAESDI